MILLELSRTFFYFSWNLTHFEQVYFYLAHELHQLASTSNEYFSFVLNFLRSSMGTRYLKLMIETIPDRRRSGPWESLGNKEKKNTRQVQSLFFMH